METRRRKMEMKVAMLCKSRPTIRCWRRHALLVRLAHLLDLASETAFAADRLSRHSFPLSLQIDLVGTLLRYLLMTCYQ